MAGRSVRSNAPGRAGGSEVEPVPTWVAGISIGAFNAVIIAATAPERRVEALNEFRETIWQP